MSGSGHVMRLFPGGSSPVEIDEARARSYRGTVGAVLPAILIELGDEEQKQFAREPGSVFELATPRETPIDPNEDWQNYVSLLAESDVELGMGKAHRGGR